MTFKRLEKLRWWVQKTMPAIYDDSLSYYELLAKMAKVLQEMSDIINEQSEEIENQTEEINSLRTDYNAFIATVNQTITDALQTFRQMFDDFTTSTTQDINAFKTQINLQIQNLTTTLQNQYNDFVTTVNNRFTTLSDEMQSQYNTFIQTINHNFAELSSTIMDLIAQLEREFSLYTGNTVEADVEYEEAVLMNNGTPYTTSNFVADELAVLDLSSDYKGYTFEIPADGTTIICDNFTGLPTDVVGAVLTRMERHSGDLTYGEYVKEILFSGDGSTSFQYTVNYNDFPQGANYENQFAIRFIVPSSTEISVSYRIRTDHMFVVNLNYDSVNDSYSTDKTYNEILEAFDNNLPVYCKSDALETIEPVKKDGRRLVLSSRLSETGNYSCLEMIADNSITEWSQQLWTNP